MVRLYSSSPSYLYGIAYQRIVGCFRRLEEGGGGVAVERDSPLGSQTFQSLGLYQVACAVTIYNVSRNLTIDAYSQSRNWWQILQKMYPSNLESSL